MFLDVSNIFSLAYLLNLNPGPFIPVFFNILVPVFGLMVIAGFLFQKYAKQHTYPPVKKFFTKLHRLLFNMGILGLLYIFFRQQNIYLVSAPFWLLIWLIVVLIWVGFILKYYFTDRPELEEKIKKEQEKKKYLPS